MAVKRIDARPQAKLDVDDAIDYLLLEAGEGAALAFTDALQSALEQIAAFPASGSNRYAHQLGLPGLRVCPVKTYPYLVFYMARPDHIDVWRVLHAQRDIPEELAGP